MYTMFADLTQAFDSVNHTLLWKKLETMGLSPKIIKNLSSFYSKLSLKTNTRQGWTKDIPITKGVLQGDPLSPLLFILFLADLPLFIPEKCGIKLGPYNFKALLYADDILLLANNRLSLKSGMKALRQYFLANNLNLNCSKTKIIHFSKKSCNPAKNKFRWNGQTIEVVPQWTYLGVIFQATGIYSAHSRVASKKPLINYPSF